MADLPLERVIRAPPFSVTGVDFAGPVTLKKGHTRRPVFIKAYVAVFVCFKTRATHLEVVSDLTTSAFLACMKRFVSRRGIPVILQSDNGSNFKGARRKLEELYRFLQQQHSQSIVHQQLLEDRITWKMIPERAPHFGGLWEAAVKSMKHHLKRIVGSKALTFEEMMTVVCQIEACLNSRPILATTQHNEEGIFTLTSGHFLIGRAIKSYPEKDIPEDISLLKRWNLGQAMVQHFWTRWSSEYLSSLQARTKWTKTQPNLEVGDVVVLREDQTFACNWPLAKVTQTFPGKDGLVRVATIRTASGDYKRPVLSFIDHLNLPKRCLRALLPGQYVQTRMLDSARLKTCSTAPPPELELTLLQMKHYQTFTQLYHVRPFNITS